MKIALAHDSFTQAGGAERVVEALHELYPTAPVYTTVVDAHYPKDLSGWRIVVSPLQYVYTLYAHFQYLFPLVPAALWFVRIPKEYDVLLSSSSSFAKAIHKPRGSVHVLYCHTPTRFIWTDVAHAVKETPWPFKLVVRPFLYVLRWWDLAAARRVDVFIANSQEVQRRIQQFYGRESTVVYPFVDTEFWRPTKPKADYFLLAGRLQAHKQNEMVVELFNRLGLPLHVVGTGRQEAYLRSIAKPNIHFFGRVSDEALRDEYSGARGYIYPQKEDAGITPLEAAACGTATIGLNVGGTAETVVPHKTGEWFSEGSEQELQALVEQWDESRYTVTALREQAEAFGKPRFLHAIQQIVEKATKQARE